MPDDSPTRTANAMQLGPETKELNLLRADEEYNTGNVLNSIYYQVKALFHIGDSRYAYDPKSLDYTPPSADELLAEFNEDEKEDFKSNLFMQNVVKFLKEMERKEGDKPKCNKPNSHIVRMDFLENYDDAAKGLKHIESICNQFPEEWTVVQFCKSFNPSTTYTVFKEIQESDGAIYLTLLRHCRSPDYPPVCLRIHSPGLTVLLKKYATIIDRFREIINVDPRECKGSLAKEKYWKDLKEFEIFLEESCILELKKVLNPWIFLLKGKRYQRTEITKVSKRLLKRVDVLCDQYNWDAHRRVILSQAALQAKDISREMLRNVSEQLTENTDEANLVFEMIYRCRIDWQYIDENEEKCKQRYPCILIVDERLDHFHWEQLDVQQEFTRVKSLHCLWRLFSYHKSRIKNGYYTVDIKDGYCLVNPEGNLPNSGKRLRSFFEYWLPNWSSCYEKKPTESDLFNEAFKKDCYIYAGHGSGLQYFSGKQISKTLINSVVFLFGCDSTRMLGNGLFSGMIGPHNFYHGAMCPTVIGTLMPALDANMDGVAVHLLSAWIAPTSKDILPWSSIDTIAWAKRGEIKAKSQKDEKAQTMRNTTDYHSGSLCSILKRVHMREIDPKIYNSCVYVCRGLPPWNANVETFTV